MATQWDKLLRSSGRKKYDADIAAAAKSVAAATGVPEDLLRTSVIALAAKESGFNDKAKNTEFGASGLLQYIPGAAKDRKIDPFNAQQSIMAATKDAAEAYKRGGVAEIAASHFAGAGGTGRGPKTREYVRDFLEGLTQLGTPAYRYASARPASTKKPRQPLDTSGEMNPFDAAPAPVATAMPATVDPMMGDANPFATSDSPAMEAPAAFASPQYDLPTPKAPRMARLDTNPFGGFDVQRDPTTLKYFEPMIENANG